MTEGKFMVLHAVGYGLHYGVLIELIRKGCSALVVTCNGDMVNK